MRRQPLRPSTRGTASVSQGPGPDCGSGASTCPGVRQTHFPALWVSAEGLQKGQSHRLVMGIKYDLSRRSRKCSPGSSSACSAGTCTQGESPLPGNRPVFTVLRARAPSPARHASHEHPPEHLPRLPPASHPTSPPRGPLRGGLIKIPPSGPHGATPSASASGRRSVRRPLL